MRPSLWRFYRSLFMYNKITVVQNNYLIIFKSWHSHFYSSLIYYIPTEVSPSHSPVSLPPTYSLLLYHHLLDPQKTAGLPGTTEHGIKIPGTYYYSKAKWGHPVGREESHKQAKESETASDPNVRNPTRIPSHTAITYMQRTFIFNDLFILPLDSMGSKAICRM